MKKIEGFFIALILSTGVFSVMAQNEQNTLRDVVDRDTYGDNWFISFNGNANLLVAEQDGYTSALDRIKFGGAFTVGKWFNADLGARIQVMGGSLRGFQNVLPAERGYYVHHNYRKEPYPIGGDPLDAANASKYTFFTTKQGVQGFWQDFNYATATFDLMHNFSNLMRGRYRENSSVDFIPFVGIGAILAFNNNVTTPNYHHFVAKIGFRVNFNVTENIAIYLEPQANATPPEFDGYSGTAFGDGIVNLGLGLQYTFNKRFTSLSQLMQLTADEIDRLNKKINDNRYLIENHQDILERQQNLLDRLEKDLEGKKTAPPPAPDHSSGGNLTEYVRFLLDSYKIQPSEKAKIDEVASYLKKNPDSKLVMIGYADKKTGNPRYNWNLSQRRVNAVAGELRRLGINNNRLLLEWRGDREQPFPQNEWNRVVIMVERK